MGISGFLLFYLENKVMNIKGRLYKSREERKLKVYKNTQIGRVSVCFKKASKFSKCGGNLAFKSRGMKLGSSARESEQN